MNLKELRTQFVKRNGRYDLVVDNVAWVDNGADFYINAGQRYIDRLDTTHKSEGKNFQYVTSGDYYVTFPFCRAVKEVFALDADGQKRLEKVDYDKLRAYYADRQSQLTTGEPSYYFPAGIRLVPESDRLTIDELDAMIDWTHIIIDPSYNYNGVLFWPPADGNYTVEINGLFYSPDLASDDDHSFWSTVHPEILLMAANRQMEIDYRNTQGVKDWEAAIQTEILGLGKDLVEEHIADVDQMVG
jgi:hypothetical protein